MILPRIAFLSLTLVTAASALAQDTPPGEKYELKTRSNFNLPGTVRPPFWPIGWTRRDGSAPVPGVVVKAFDETSFTVTSILLGNPSLAVINGRAYTEGDVVRTPKPKDGKEVKDAPVARIRVQRILDGMVQLQASDQTTISVPLRRAELSEKKPGEELLNDAR